MPPGPSAWPPVADGPGTPIVPAAKPRTGGGGDAAARGPVPVTPGLLERRRAGGGHHDPRPRAPAVGSQDAGTADPAGRGRAQIPAGDALDADGASPDRPRTYTIALPAGLKLLNLNDRGHWATRYRRSQDLKKAACVMALKAKVPRLGRVSVVAEYQPPDRRHRDADNPVASVKAAIDGIVAAGVLPSDESPRYVESVTCRIGQPYPKGRLVLYVTEVPGGADDAA